MEGTLQTTLEVFGLLGLLLHSKVKEYMRSMYSCQLTLRADRVKDILDALTVLYCVRFRLPLP